ncbi:MAG: hypothetical protein RL762_973 [Bacteroidota bacterium]|jgi:hypothetical protein
MSRYLYFILLFLSPETWAQNLVENGDFETYSSLPTNVMQSQLCTGWSACSQGGGGTPDYFHLNGLGLVQLPNSFYATISPHGGSAIMGIIAYHGVSTDYREYISHSLSSPLVIGATYTLSCWLSNGHYNGNYGGSAANHLGVALTMNEPQQLGTTPLSTITPQLEESSLIYDTNWTQLSYIFVADSAYEHLVIGNFKNNANTTVQNIENHPIELAYYFIDDVSLIRVEGSAGLTSNVSSKLRLVYHPDAQLLYLTGDSTNEYLLQISNLEGKLQPEIDLSETKTCSIQHLPSGVYFYKLSSKDAPILYGKFVKYNH